MRREKDPDVRAERKSILLALLAAVSSCGMFYARPLERVSETVKVRRTTEKAFHTEATESTEGYFLDRSKGLKF